MDKGRVHALVCEMPANGWICEHEMARRGDKGLTRFGRTDNVKRT